MKKILVIDDEEWLRELVKIALSERGFEVLEADNGAVGIEKARKHLPDLILCDVRMEKVDGFLTLSELRNHPETAPIPFILITGQADQIGMRHGMELGADDYLPKPFTIEGLLAAVEARLRKVQSVRQEAEKALRNLRENISFMLPHELRTPLNGIIGYGELLMTSPETLSHAEIAEMGKAITDSSKRLETLIDKYLIYVQLELIAADNLRVSSLRQQQTDDPAAVVQETATEQARCLGREADLRLDIEPVRLGLAPEYFAIVVKELVQNAFKFSVSGSAVTLELRAENGGGSLAVTDNGVGLSPDQIRQIGAYMQFERKPREQQGLGLGLVLVRRIAELHGGNVLIQSAKPSGTRVQVNLPPPISEPPRY